MPLTYNKKIVDHELDLFKKNNPKADAEAIQKQKEELISRESIYAIWIDYETRFKAKGRTPEEIEDDVRNTDIENLNRITKYFQRKNNPEKERYLESLQKLSFETKDPQMLPEFATSVITDFSHLSRDEYKDITQKGDEYMRGLFAPETDSADMPFDTIVENNLIKIQMLRDTQAEADKIKIDVPEGKTADYVSFIVMGEFFKEKHLNKTTKYLFSKGSTLPQNYSAAESSIATFFENTVKSEPRANMHAVRLIIPDVRKDAKELIESGNQEEINNNIKHAFNTLYERASVSTAQDFIMYRFAVRQLTRLLKTVEQNGIKPMDLGITEEKINMIATMQKIVDFQAETEKMVNSMKEGAEEFFFSGYSKEYDIAEKPEKQELLFTIAARKEVIKKLKADLVGLRTMYEMNGVNDVDEKMATRKLIDMEKRFVNDQEALITEARQRLKTTEALQSYNEKIKTPNGRISLMTNTIEFTSKNLSLVPVDAFINETQDIFLNILEEYVQNRPGTEKLAAALKKVRDAAAEEMNSKSKEALYSLIGPYSDLYQECQAFQKTLPQAEMLTNPDHLRFISSGDRISELLTAFKADYRCAEMQAAFNEKRREYHEKCENNIVNYDPKRASERLTEFKLGHPNCSEKQLFIAQNNIITEEAVLYSRILAFEKTHPDGDNLMRFDEAEQRFINGTEEMKNDLKLLNQLNGEEKLVFLQSYQKNMAKIKSAEELQQFNSCIESLNIAAAKKNDSALDAETFENLKQYFESGFAKELDPTLSRGRQLAAEQVAKQRALMYFANPEHGEKHRQMNAEDPKAYAELMRREIQDGFNDVLTKRGVRPYDKMKLVISANKTASTIKNVTADFDNEFAELKRGLRPAFCERFEEYFNALEELGPDRSLRDEYNAMLTGFDDLNRELSSLYGNPKARDTVLSRVDMQRIKDLYETALKNCTEYLNANGKDPMSNDRAFMASTMQGLLARDMNLFEKLPESNQLTLSDALQSRYGEPVNVDDTVARFVALADRLSVYGSRFGGNTDEFNNMKDALDQFKDGKINGKTLKTLTDALFTHTEIYINAKEAVPSTEKGKQRLAIAREARELINEYRLANKWEYRCTRQKDTSSYEDKLKAVIKDRESASLKGMQAALNSNDKAAYTKQLSEIIYLKEVENKLTKNGDVAAEYLEPATMERGTGKIRVKAEEMMRKLPPKDLIAIINSPNPTEKLNKAFKEYVAESILERSRNTADLSDSYGASNRPNLNI